MNGLIWVLIALFTIQTLTIGLGLMEIRIAIEEERHKKININLPEELINDIGVKTCVGCKHHGKWINELENGYPSPCTFCSRCYLDNYVDNYEGDKMC